MGGVRDRWIVLSIFGVVLGFIVVASIFSPANDDTDRSPTTYNSGSAGTKAAYLLLGELGYGVSRWESAPEKLKDVDAAKTTLILAEPVLPLENRKEVQGEIADFLSRGGRVLATGQDGAYFLPDGKTGVPTRLYQKLCFSTPEGAGPLAQAGKVSIADDVRWDALGPRFRVSQRCGEDAVVVSYKYGQGEAMWWSSPMPLTNRGLKEDASLKLVLASVGTGRRVLFDEYFHGERETLWDTAKGLPLGQLSWQAVAVAVLLVLSFGRRNGPLRGLVRVPRSSPLEFAESMGRLYRKAGATQAATDGARRRLLRFLEEQCGISREVLRSSPEAIVESIQERMGGSWSRVGVHLTQAAEAEQGAVTLTSALELVKALDRDQRDLAESIRSSMGKQMVSKGAI